MLVLIAFNLSVILIAMSIIIVTNYSIVYGRCYERFEGSSCYLWYECYERYER